MLASAPTDNEADVFACLQTSSVPVLPAGVPELIAVLGDPDVPFEKLAAALERFPAIIARLLALANSPWSAPSVPVVSLHQATARLGLGIVRSVGIAMSVAAPFNPRACPSFDAQRFWCSGLMTAAASAALAEACAGLSPPVKTVARTAGLMRNLGLLWMVDSLPAATEQALLAVADNPNLRVNAALQSACGVGHGRANGVLGAAWNLPPLLVSAMSNSTAAVAAGNGADLVRVVDLAAAMVATLLGDPDADFDPSLHSIAGIDADACERIYASLAIKLPQTRKLAESLFR